MEDQHNDPVMIERLTDCAKLVFDSIGGAMPVTVKLEVTLSPGGVRTVEYSSNTGDSLADRNSVRAWKWKRGTSPEACSAELMAECADHHIREKIRTEHLHKLASDLGFVVSRRAKRTA